MRGSSSLLRDIDQIDINPVVFRRLVDLANSFDSSSVERVEKVFTDTWVLCAVLDEEIMQLSGSFNSLLSEVRQATKRSNPFSSLMDEGDDDEDPLAALSHTAGENFLRVVLDIMESIQTGFHMILKTAKNIRPVRIELLEDKFKLPKNFEELQMFHLELQMHGPTLGNFTNGILNAYQGPNEIIRLGRLITEKLDRYYQILNHRHSVEGIEIHQDPIITDVALSIYENVDAHGEIQDGKNPDEISAYTIRKATILAESLRTGLLGSFMREPERFIDFIQTNLKVLWESSIELNGLVSDFVSRLQEIVNLGRKPAHINEGQFQRALSFINDLNPSNVTYKEKTGLLSLEERHELDFRNATLRCISIMLTDGAKTNSIIDYILNRKKELREYNLEENSFFVCKIGGGNPFTRESPGELKVVPGIKPTVDLSEVIGSGFKEVIAFMRNVLDSAKWFDLFLATSPSKKADKSNVLLVGPQGSGKTEALRAVASDRNSLGIFAQASDFLTCWKGEAEKNPKRLFEAALKLQRESRKQVFILLDEIDTVLNGDRGQLAFGGTNLATEFQVLMDGITSYPHLALWGATNHPERISTPLIRRFSKVIIVGELNQEDRVKLLKQFLGYLPISDQFDDEAWNNAAESLNGAVGDIIRKIIDHVWREKMSFFVNNHPDQAEIVLELLHEGDTKFHPSQFTQAKRLEMHALLRPFVQVEPVDVSNSIQIHLSNLAIQREIQTAVATYENAKQFLADVVKN